MSSRLHDEKQIADMLDFAKLAVDGVRGWTVADVAARTLGSLGVERCIEIIGEAARGVSDEYKAAHPDVEWRKIVSTRHILAHDYGRVNHGIVFRILTIHLPKLIEQLESIAAAPPLDPQPEP